MMSTPKIGAALVGGYLLGRTKKAKLAIGLGMFLAGKRLPTNPAQLRRLMADSPVLSGLNEQVRDELVEATKTSATKALTARANNLADSIHQRTLGLQHDVGGRDGEEEEEAETKSREDLDRDEEPEATAEEEAGAADEEAEPEEKPRRRTASTARRASGAARKSVAGARKKAASTASTKERRDD